MQYIWRQYFKQQLETAQFSTMLGTEGASHILRRSRKRRCCHLELAVLGASVRADICPSQCTRQMHLLQQPVVLIMVLRVEL